MKTEPDFKPFRMLITSPSAGGKSTLIKNLLTNQLRGKFDQIFIICPTIHQPLWKSINIKDKTDNPSQEKFEEIYKQIQKNRKEEKETLLIVDDCLKTPIMASNSPLIREIMRLRHEWCSIIIASQYYKGTDPFIRINCDYQILFYIANKGEQKKLYEELGDNFEDAYKRIATEMYKYVVINFTKNELDPDRYTNQITF